MPSLDGGSDINDASVIEAVTRAHDAYETALVANDVAALRRFFWDSPDAVRFGATESLYGSDESNAFRNARPAIDLARTVSRFTVVAFGQDSAVTTIEFERTVAGVPRPGRQTQVWRRFPEGWQIVSGHISYVWNPALALDEAARAAGLTIPPQFRPGVERNRALIANMAGRFLDFPLDELVETAPVFQP